MSVIYLLATELVPSCPHQRVSCQKITVHDSEDWTLSQGHVVDGFDTLLKPTTDRLTS